MRNRMSRMSVQTHFRHHKFPHFFTHDCQAIHPPQYSSPPSSDGLSNMFVPLQLPVPLISAATDVAVKTTSSAWQIAASTISSRLHTRFRAFQFLTKSQHQFHDHCEDDWRLRCAWRQCATHPYVDPAHRSQMRLHATSSPDVEKGWRKLYNLIALKAARCSTFSCTTTIYFSHSRDSSAAIGGKNNPTSACLSAQTQSVPQWCLARKRM